MLSKELNRLIEVLAAIMTTRRKREREKRNESFFWQQCAIEMHFVLRMQSWKKSILHRINHFSSLIKSLTAENTKLILTGLVFNCFFFLALIDMKGLLLFHREINQLGFKKFKKFEQRPLESVVRSLFVLLPWSFRVLQIWIHLG